MSRRATEALALLLILAVSVLSVLKASPVPLNDSALYEWYGSALLHGQRLYHDLPEVKLPSIFYVNALLQLVFGANYLWHTCAEAALNLVTIGLFAALLRRLGVAVWAPGALLFAIFYTLPIQQFNYPEDYAIPLILLAFHLALHRRNVAAGAAMALATTFWIPSPVMAVPLLLRDVSAVERRNLIGGFVALFLAFAALFIPLLGIGWLLAPLSTWPAFLRPTFSGFDLHEILRELGGTLLHGGLGALLLVALAVVRPPRTEAQRFGLLWSACALVAAVIPPRFFEWYFLPLIAALSLTIAAYGAEALRGGRPPLERAVRAAALVACVALAAVTVRNDARDVFFMQRYAGEAMTIGTIVHQSLGSGYVLYTTQYVPEVYLLAGAVEPAVGAGNAAHYLAVASGGGGVAVAPEAWARKSQIVVDGGPFSRGAPYPLMRLADPQLHVFGTYVEVCGERTFWLKLYAKPALCPYFVAHGCSCAA